MNIRRAPSYVLAGYGKKLMIKFSKKNSRGDWVQKIIAITYNTKIDREEGERDRDRDRDTERQRQTERKKERKREKMKERERERDVCINNQILAHIVRKCI